MLDGLDGLQACLFSQQGDRQPVLLHVQLGLARCSTPEAHKGILCKETLMFSWVDPYVFFSTAFSTHSTLDYSTAFSTYIIELPLSTVCFLSLFFL
jgi:hypothetical protein